jgi:hypothetical protein
MVQIYLLTTKKSNNEQNVKTITRHFTYINKPIFTIVRYYSSIDIRMIVDKDNVVEMDDFVLGSEINSYLNQKFPGCYYTIRLSHCNNFDCSPETPETVKKSLEQNIDYKLRLDYYFCDSDKFGYAYELDYADEIFVDGPFTISKIDNVAPIVQEHKPVVLTLPFEYAITEQLEEESWDGVSFDNVLAYENFTLPTFTYSDSLHL